jgi:hypothetical protein
MNRTKTPSLLPIAALATLLLSTGPAGAQPPPPPPDDDAPTIYDSQGRRDPFRPTIGADKGSGDRCAEREGMAAVLLQEVKLTGITMTPRGPLAMWEGGPANQGYFSYEGDEFCDGAVFKIDYDNKVVTVRQVKEDPNRKLLRPWVDVPRHLYPEAANTGSGGSATTAQRGGGRIGPGNLARPNTAAKPGSSINWNQRR